MVARGVGRWSYSMTFGFGTLSEYNQYDMLDRQRLPDN